MYARRWLCCYSQRSSTYVVVEQSMQWVIVCAALEGFCSVEMLLLAMEAREVV